MGPVREENAMKTLSRFVTKFTSLIVAVLSCFDRVIFKGYLPLTNGPALEGFVDHVLKIRRCDFGTDHLNTSFHEELYNRGPGRTSPVAAEAPPRHRAFLTAAPAAGAPFDARF